MRGTRPLLTPLWRSWGLVAVVPLAVLEIANVRDLDASLMQHPPTALDGANGVLIVLNPVLAALTCAESLSLMRGARREKILTLPDGGVELLAYFSLGPGSSIDRENLTLGVIQSLGTCPDREPRFRDIERVSHWAMFIHRNPGREGSPRETELRKPARTAAERLQSCG